MQAGSRASGSAGPSAFGLCPQTEEPPVQTGSGQAEAAQLLEDLP